jgi:hypothetical protein
VLQSLAETARKQTVGSERQGSKPFAFLREPFLPTKAFTDVVLPSLKSNVASMSLSAQLANIGVAPNEDDKPVRGEWSKRATDALVESWGNKFLQQNRGNLTDLHWKGMLACCPSPTTFWIFHGLL